MKYYVVCISMALLLGSCNIQTSDQNLSSSTDHSVKHGDQQSPLSTENIMIKKKESILARNPKKCLMLVVITGAIVGYILYKSMKQKAMVVDGVPVAQTGYVQSFMNTAGVVLPVMGNAIKNNFLWVKSGAASMFGYSASSGSGPVSAPTAPPAGSAASTTQTLISTSQHQNGWCSWLKCQIDSVFQGLPDEAFDAKDNKPKSLAITGNGSKKMIAWPAGDSDDDESDSDDSEPDDHMPSNIFYDEKEDDNEVEGVDNRCIQYDNQGFSAEYDAGGTQQAIKWNKSVPIDWNQQREGGDWHTNDDDDGQSIVQNTQKRQVIQQQNNEGYFGAGWENQDFYL